MVYLIMVYLIMVYLMIAEYSQICVERPVRSTLSAFRCPPDLARLESMFSGFFDAIGFVPISASVPSVIGVAPGE